MTCRIREQGSPMFPSLHRSVLGPTAAHHERAVRTRWWRGSTTWLVIGSHPPRPRGPKARPWVQTLTSSSLLSDMPSCHVPQPLSSPVMWVSSARRPRVAGCHGPGGASLLAICTQWGLFSGGSAEWANAGWGRGQDGAMETGLGTGAGTGHATRVPYVSPRALPLTSSWACLLPPALAGANQG